MGQNHSSKSYSTRNSAASFSFSSKSSFKTIPEDSIYLRKQSSSRSSVSFSDDGPAQCSKLASKGSLIIGKSTSRSSSTSISIKKDEWSSSSHRHNFQERSKLRDTAHSGEFLRNDLIPMKTWEGQRLCQEDESIRKTYIEYITSFSWMDMLGRRIAEILSHKVSSLEATDHLLFDDYLVCPRERSSLSDEQNNREDVSSKMMRLSELRTKDSMNVGGTTVASYFTDEQLSYLLLATVWPIFVVSPDFARVAPYHVEIDSNIKNIIQPMDSPLSPHGRNTEMDKVRYIKDIFYHIVMDLKDQEIDNLLVDGCWIEKVLEIVEYTVIPVSITSPDNHIKEFPIVYVNQAFEKMTLFDRSEVLGHNYYLLQSPNTERDYVRKVADAISKGSGVKVVMINSRKDGNDFMNLVSLRPIYDPDGNYIYTLGIQCDSSRNDLSLKDIKLAEDFQLIFCNIMKG